MNKQLTMKETTMSFLAMAAVTAVASAGDPVPPPPPTIEVEEESAVSGTLSLDYNTHFISYGNDVWDVGQDFGDDATFNPSLELAWQLTDSLSAYVGTWWDVNNNWTQSIGGDLQEVDVWFGMAYDFGLVTVSGTYQAWIYGGDTEQVFDLGIGFDTFLSPSLTLHNRFEEGASGGRNGNVLVFGIEQGLDLGCASLSFPANVGYFIDDEFHGVGVTDEGFGFTSFGVTASVPLSFIDDKFGAWDIHGGLIYYITDEDVTGDADNNFLTGNIGISCAF